MPGVGHLQNVHPLFVHYPIALLAAATLFYVVAWVARSERWAFTAYVTLLFGTAGGALAIATGLYAGGGVMVSRSVRAALLERHEALMLTTGCLALAASIWATIQRPFPRRLRPLFIALLFAMIGVLFKGADDGGRMVYDYNAGGSACGQPIEFTK
jgi:uncharacterized membrane protein